MAKKVQIEIEAKDGASKALDKIGKKAGAASVSARGLGTAFMAVGAAAVGAAVAVFKIAKAVADARNQLQDAAKRTGIAASTLQGLKIAAESSGQSFQNMERVLRGFTGRLGAVQSGSSEAIEVFERLRVKTHDVDGAFRSADVIFKESIASLGKMANETERNAEMTILFGTSGTRLAQALGDMNGQLALYIDFAEKYGVKTGPEAAKASARWQAATARFANVMPGMMDNIAGKSGFGGLPTVIDVVTGALLGLGHVVPVVLKSMLKPFLEIGEAMSLLSDGQMVKGFKALGMAAASFHPVGALVRGTRAWSDVSDAMSRGKQIAEDYIHDADALDRALGKSKTKFDEDEESISKTADAMDGLTTSTHRAGKAIDKTAEKTATAVIMTRPLWVLLADLNDELPAFTAGMNQSAAELEKWAKSAQSAMRTDAMEGLMALATGDLGAFLGRLGEGEKPLMTMAAQAGEAFKSSIMDIVFALPLEWSKAITNAFDRAKSSIAGIISAIGGTKAGQAVGSALSGISTGVMAAAPVAGAALAGFQALGGATTASGAAVTSGQGAAAVIGDQLDELQDQIMIGIEALPIILGEVLPAFLPKFISALVEAIPALVTGLLKATPKLIKALAFALPIAILKGMVQWFAIAWARIKQWFSDLFSPMRRAAEKDLSGIVDEDLFKPIARTPEEARQLQAEYEASQGLQEGSRFVDRTRRMLLHRGEQVVPRGGVATQTNMGSGAGGPSIVINTAVVDSDTIPRLVEMIQQTYGDFGRATSPLFSGA